MTPITETTVCTCPACKSRRARQLTADLNAMADRRQLTNRFFDLEYNPPPVHVPEPDVEKKLNAIQAAAIGIACCALFFYGLWELALEVAQKAGM